MDDENQETTAYDWIQHRHTSNYKKKTEIETHWWNGQMDASNIHKYYECTISTNFSRSNEENVSKEDIWYLEMLSNSLQSW